MTISEFAESRNVQSQAVNRYVLRHSEEFSGHTQKVGKNIELDDEAVRILDEKYPLPKPVQLVEGVPTEDYLAVQKELNAAKNTIIGLQNKLTDYSMKIASAEAIHLRLEDKEKELQSVKTDLKNSEDDKAQLREKLVRAESKNEQYEGDLKRKDEELRQAEKNTKLTFCLAVVFFIVVGVLIYLNIL